MSSILYFNSIDDAREALLNDTESDYGNRLQKLKKIFPTNMMSGKYKINRLQLMNINQIENYCVLIKNIGLYPIINILPDFKYDDMIKYIDMFNGKDCYKIIVERFVTSFLCCAIQNNDPDMFNKIVERVMYHSTDSGKYIYLGFRNISFAGPYSNSSQHNDERYFYFKKDLFLINFMMEHPDIKTPNSATRNLIINLIDTCKMNRHLRISHSCKNMLSRAISKYREHLVDNLNGKSHAIVTYEPSLLKSADYLFDYIESNSFALKNLILECDDGWYGAECIKNVSNMLETDKNRLVRACVAYFNSDVRRCYEKEKAQVFVILNNKFPDLNAFDNILPKISEKLQTAILAAMI